MTAAPRGKAEANSVMYWIELGMEDHAYRPVQCRLSRPVNT